MTRLRLPFVGFVSLSLLLAASCSSNDGSNPEPTTCDRESDVAFCMRLSVVCGTASGNDLCGDARSVQCDLCDPSTPCNPATSTCECAGDDDHTLCQRNHKACGTARVTDSCGVEREVECGSCDMGLRCNDSNACELCVSESDAALCSRLQAECGTVTAQDSCGEPRSADCGRCQPHFGCLANNTCAPCVSETDAEYCAQFGESTCGFVTDVDNCNVERTFNCGACDNNENCDVTHHCNPCVPETDHAFCARFERTCGPLIEEDNCGALRTVEQCGACPDGDRCDAGACVLCTGESDLDLCAWEFRNCGTPALTDRCGVPRTPACGTCELGSCLPNGVCGTPGLASNDTCLNPVRIVLDSTGTASGTADATGADNGTWGTCGGGGVDVFFAFDLAIPRVVTVTITPTNPGFEPIVYLRQDCNGSSDFGCGAATGAGQPVTVTSRPLGAGTWYLVVDSSFASVAGPFSYVITSAAPPAPPLNDTCRRPKKLTFTNGFAQAFGDTSYAAGDYNDSCSWATLDGPDVVYRFSIAAPSAVMARVAADVANPNYAPGLELLSSCPSTGTAVNCGVPFSGTASAGNSNLAAGDYFLIVDGVGASFGAYALEVTVAPPVLNDLCTGATPVALTAAAGSTTLVGSIQGDTGIATDDDTSSCNRWGTGRDLAYSITVPEGGPKNVTIEVVPANNSAIIPVISLKTDCAASDDIACELSTNVGSTVVTTVKRLAPGTYYALVDGWNTGGNGPFTLNVTVAEPPPPPSHDTCAHPIAIALDTATGVGQVAGTTRDGGNDYAGGCAAGWMPHNGPDVVYSVAVAAGQDLTASVTRADATPNFRPAVYIVGTCGDSSTEKACAGESSGIATASATNLTAGTYFIVVDGISGTEGDFTLDVLAAAPLTNDACGNPKTIGFDNNGNFVAHGDSCTLSNDTSSSGSGACFGGGGGGNDLVYKLVTTDVQNLDLTYAPGHANGTQIYLRTDCGAQNTEVRCGSAVSGANHLKVKNLPAGTYYVWLDSDWGCGLFTFSAHLSNPPTRQRNDVCTTAEAVALDQATGHGSATGNTDAATGDTEATCAASTGPELVYSFTLGGARTVTIDLTPQSGSDLVPVLYVRSDCAATADLACKAAPQAAAPAHLQFPRLATGTYYVYVDAADASRSGPFELVINTSDPGPVATNDACARAMAMPTFDSTTHKTSVTGDTLAGSDDDSNNCATHASPLTGSDLVYSFNLANDAKVKVTLSNTSVTTPFHPAVSVRSGCQRTGEVACALDVNNVAMLDNLSLTAGTWYVFVDGVEGGYGPFTLEVEDLGAAIAGDDCGNATPLTFIGTRALASGDLSAGPLNHAEHSCANTTGGDLVYSFTTTSDAIISVKVEPPGGGSGLAPVVALRRACDDATTELGCAYAWSSGAIIGFETGRMPAGTYFVYVDAYGPWLSGSFVLTVDVTPPAHALAANDTCAHPTPVGLDPVLGTARVVGDTRDGFDDYAGSCATANEPLSGGDLVYSVTLGQAGTLVATVTRDPASPNYLPAVYIRSASCGSARTADERGCYTTGNNPLAAVTAANLPAGTYWIVVDGEKGTSGAFALDVGVRAGTSSNDSCVTAKTLQLNTDGVAEVVGDTSAGGSASEGGVGCTSSGPELYYAFTTVGTKDVTLEVIPGNASYQPAVYLRSSCADARSVKACEYNWGGSPLKAMVLRLPGGNYTAVVDSQNAAAAGPFVLRVTAVDPPPPPAHDTCANPRTIAVPTPGAAPTVVTDSTLPGNDDYTSTCGTATAPINAPDVVYKFTLTGAAEVTAKVTPKPTSPGYKAAVYLRATCASVGDDICALAQWGGGMANPVTAKASLAPGDYYLIVDGVGGTAGDFDLELSLDATRYVAGDHCLNAKSIDALFVAGTAPNEMVATVTGDTSFARGDSDGTCNGNSGPDLVYSFTLARESYVAIDVAADANSAYYPYFYVRSTCSDARSQLFCKVQYGSTPPLSGSLFHVPAGTYYLFVDGYASWSSANGPFTATVKVRDTPTPPLNDVCRNATTLNFTSVGGGTQERLTLAGQDSTFANNDAGGSCASSAGNDLMYKFTLQAARSFTATVTPDAASADFVPVVYLRTACEQAGDAYEVTCRQAGGPGPSGAPTVSVNRLPAGDYWLIVDTYRANPNELPGGKFTLDASTDVPVAGPANDGCAFAQNVVPATGSPSVTTLTNQTTANAVDDTASMCGASQGGPDVVYKVEVATASQMKVVVTPSGSFYPAVYLRKTCGSTARADQLACDYQMSVAMAVEANRSYVRPGTYYVWVDGGTSTAANASGVFDMTITLSTPTAVPPANDICGSSVPQLTRGVAVTGTTVNAVNDYFFINGSCGYWNIDGGDVVYAYTPTVSGPFAVSLTANDQDLMPWMTEAACGDPNGCVMASDTSGGSGGVDSFTYPSGRAGVTYYIHVDANAGGYAGTFTLLVQ